MLMLNDSFLFAEMQLAWSAKGNVSDGFQSRWVCVIGLR